jgi:transposase
MTATGRVVVGGVDCHAEFHHASAIDEQGRAVADGRFPATGAGYADMLAWLRGHGEVRSVGVESSGSYGAGLTRYLAAAGVRVLEVNRPHTHLKHRRGKSDAIDAEAAARKVLAGEVQVAPKDTAGVIEAMPAAEGSLRQRRQGQVRGLGPVGRPPRDGTHRAEGEARPEDPAGTGGSVPQGPAGSQSHG